jgi:hypothetical protein
MQDAPGEGHLLHSVPSVDKKVVAGHGVAAVLPAGHNAPGLHVAGAMLPAWQKLPAGHCLPWLLFSAQNEPPLHGKTDIPSQ